MILFVCVCVYLCDEDLKIGSRDIPKYTKKRNQKIHKNVLQNAWIK